MEGKTYTQKDIINVLKRLQWKLDPRQDYDIWDITTEELWCLNAAIISLQNKEDNKTIEHENELYGSDVWYHKTLI